MIREFVKNHPVIISDLEDIEGSWLEIEDMGHPDLIIVLDIEFPTCAKFKNSNIIRSVKKPYTHH